MANMSKGKGKVGENMAEPQQIRAEGEDKNTHRDSPTVTKQDQTKMTNKEEKHWQDEGSKRTPQGHDMEGVLRDLSMNKMEDAMQNWKKCWSS